MTGFEEHSGAAPHKAGAFDGLLDLLLPFRRTRKKMEKQHDRLEAFLRAIPIEYCGWDQEGVQAISGGFCSLIGVGMVDSLADIQTGLSPGDAAALEGLYDRLQQYGEHFEIGVHTASGKRALKIFGKRGLIQQSGQIFSVIWAMDITDFAHAAMRGVEAIAAVEKRENELRTNANALPFPIWVRNHRLDITWCNKAYAKVCDDTGASVVAEQKELPMTGASKADLTQRVLAQRAMAKLAPQSMRGHMIVEGQRRLIEITEIPLPQEKRVVGVALDVTKEEEWETSYERLSASHREALEQLRTAIAMFDVDTRLEFYNSAYEQLTGMSGTWLDTKPKMIEIIEKMRELRKLPEQADYKQFKQAWVNKFTSLLEPYEEMQYLPDGSVVRMIVVPRPMGGLLLTLEDVTSRLQLETSYNTLIAVQEETMNNLSEGIAVFGEDGRVRLSNQAFARMWNIPAADMQGAPHIMHLIERTRPYFDPPQWPAMKQAIMANALEREPRKGRIQRNNGTVLEFSIVPLPDGNILNAYFDITDTVKVEQALMEKNAALEEAERLKTDFLANVSYQLRTPLNAIMGFAEMLNQQYFGKLNDRQLEYTSSMIEAGQRLVSLVNDILDLSTIEAGYLKLYPAEVRVRSLIEQVVQLTEEWARKQKLDLIIQCPDDRLTVTADERRMKQVLLNLISNAINYSPNGGRVTISAQRAGDFVLVAVRDTGVGIPAADLERVFTPFEKIHSKKTGRRSGAGLGLALVKSIVQLHGGDVTIESKEGAGTNVICKLPLHQPAAGKVAAPPEKKTV
ncbi:MAG: PAS domain-containing protein [Alphaproteobacteria bacterium]|nr:MAG: PAS domain-containing protein [Alphaproteobacteria bacterium]